MTQEQIKQLLNMIAVIETGIITILILKLSKYLIKLINYIKKKIKEN